MKRKISEDTKQKLIESKCVSADEEAFWLIDYWCGKDVKGLIQMPFSRHWIMHIEAMQRIKNRLCKIARKGVDPVAICGLSCNHCFLAEWCGGCRTKYNACSFATCSEGRICPNVKCCNEKNIDGCHECSELETCEKGFYVTNLSIAQVKQKHGNVERDNYNKTKFTESSILLSVREGKGNRGCHEAFSDDMNRGE